MSWPHHRFARVLLIAYGLLFAALAFTPKDRFIWALENAPALIAVTLLVITANRFPLSRISYTFIFVFTCLQAYEYGHAAFKFSGHIYGATFFMATGFHGAHVIIGTIFLAVCLFRAMQGHFTPKQHFGFEAAAWYWHFVDVVWLFLFVCIYVWGAGTPAAH